MIVLTQFLNEYPFNRQKSKITFKFHQQKQKQGYVNENKNLFKS